MSDEVPGNRPGPGPAAMAVETAPTASDEARAVALLVSLLTLGLVDAQLIAPVLPEIASSFGVTDGAVGRTVSGYAVAAAVAALLIGPLSDASGRRRFLVAAGLVFASGSLAVTLSGTFPTFVLARVLTGAGAGIISALVVAAIADAVPYARRGRAMGFVAAAYFAAPILGVPLAARVADAAGWRANYVIFALLGGLVALAVVLWFREPPTRARVDRGLRVSRYLGFLGERSKAAGALSAFFVTGGLTGFLLYLGAYLRAEFSLTLSEVGNVFLLSGLASLAGAVGAGRLADRLGKLRLALAGSIALALALAVVPSAGNAPATYVVLALVGLFAAARVAPLQSLVTELVSKEERGAYVALRNTLSQGGNATAAAAGALLYEGGGFAPVCYMTAGFTFCAFLLLLAIREPSVVSEEG